MMQTLCREMRLPMSVFLLVVRGIKFIEGAKV
jgi:hypothetical protein